MRYLFILVFPFLVLCANSNAQPCQAQFNYSTNGLNVQFQDSSVLPPGGANFFWDFGDFSTSPLRNPMHNYSQAGTYRVYLTISNSTNCFDSTSALIIVSSIPTCPVNFTHSQLNSPNFTISFNGVATITQQSLISWDFGDNTTDFTNNLNPTHTYSSEGTYTVKMNYFDSLTNCTSSHIDSVTVRNIFPCTANFEYSVSVDTLLVFDSSRNYTSISYTFGDGNSSNQANPTHIYSQSGSYTVCQTIFDSINNCRDSLCKIISIKIPAPCKAGFITNVIQDTISFINKAISFNRIHYDFGDGDTSNLLDPKHSYSTSGEYIITQSVYNDTINCIDVFKDTLQVNIASSCFASFSPALDTSKSDLLYLINNSSELNTHQYLWTFGDGNSSSLRNPSHSYSDNIPHEVCLTVTDQSLGSCISIHCDTIGLDTNGNILKSGGYNLRVLDGSFIGIDEKESINSVKYYPNPFQSAISLQYSEKYPLEYEIVNINSQIVISGKVENKTIDLSYLKGGIYFLILKGKNENVVRKLVKQY